MSQVALRWQEVWVSRRSLRGCVTGGYFRDSPVKKSLSHFHHCFCGQTWDKAASVCYIMLKAFNCHPSLQNPPQLNVKCYSPTHIFSQKRLVAIHLNHVTSGGLDGTRDLEWRNVQSGESQQRLTEWLIFMITVSGLVQWCPGLNPAIGRGLQRDTPRINCLIIVTVSLLHFYWCAHVTFSFTAG